jgi:hypothetical protein
MKLGRELQAAGYKIDWNKVMRRTIPFLVAHLVTCEEACSPQARQKYLNFRFG